MSKTNWRQYLNDIDFSKFDIMYLQGKPKDYPPPRFVALIYGGTETFEKRLFAQSNSTQVWDEVHHDE